MGERGKSRTRFCHFHFPRPALVCPLYLPLCPCVLALYYKRAGSSFSRRCFSPPPLSSCRTPSPGILTFDLRVRRAPCLCGKFLCWFPGKNEDLPFAGHAAIMQCRDPPAMISGRGAIR
jgi:hypothetical protein